MSAGVLSSVSAKPRQAAATPAALRWFPSSRDLVIFLPWMVLLASPTGITQLLGDGDTGWHLRTGEWILNHGAIPRQDLFSFTAEGRPWYAWEWLWDLCFGWLHRQAGMEGVVLATIALLSLSLVVLYRECLSREGDFLVSFTVVFLAASCSAIHWLARPHLLTILFVAVTALVLDRARPGSMRLLAWLPLLTVVWANLHAGFFAGWTLIAAYAAGRAGEAFLDRRPVWSQAKPFVWTLFACVAASLVNPYGWKLHSHIWSYLTDSYHRDSISEFQSISFHSPEGAFFAVYLCLAGMSLIWSLQRRRLVESLIVLGWGWLALYSTRNIPILVFATAPAVAKACGEMLRALEDADLPLSASLMRFTRWRRELGAIDRVPRVSILAGLVFFLLAAAVCQPGAPAKLQARFSPATFPEGAVNAVKNLPPSARLFTNDYWGGFLIYRLFPSRRVFIDGRSDLHGRQIGNDMSDALSAGYRWQKILDQYGIDSVLLSPRDPLSGAMKETSRWRTVYDDGVSILFVSQLLIRGSNAAVTINPKPM